jgi:ribosomal protein S18 acetylase RimI-like enzyme
MQATSRPTPLPQQPAARACKQHQQQHRPHLSCCSAAPAARSPSPSPKPKPPPPPNTTNNNNKIRIRLARPEDYWEASDLHCASFFEQETPQQRIRRLNLRQQPPGPAPSRRGAVAARDGRWMPAALRVDRCVSLQLNDDLERRGVGRTALLLAEMDVEDKDADEEEEEEEDQAAVEAAATTPPADPLAFPRPLFFLSRLLQPPVLQGLDAALSPSPSSPPLPNRRNTLVIGAAAVDSFGDLVPPRRLDPGRDGAFGWVKRSDGQGRGYAYLSNVCVHPRVRRRGVARMLVEAAERVASGEDSEGEGEGEGRGGRSGGGDDENDDGSSPPPWSCRAAVLHCSPTNEAALRLYESLGYRRVALEPAWSPYTSGRGAGGRCLLLVRPLLVARRRRRGGGGGGLKPLE